MAAWYMLQSRDPDGTFLSQSWRTEFLPRIGETVLLPDNDNWQEMTVETVVHEQHYTSVWLVGSDGWENGSVTTLFNNAKKVLEKFIDDTNRTSLPRPR